MKNRISNLVPTNRKRLKGSVEFRNVSFTYPNSGIEALKNVSFSINGGASLGILGKTGAGKSTITALLVRQ